MRPGQVQAREVRPGEARSYDVSVPTPDAQLRGILTIPEGSVGVVLFAHGSGSGRLSPRNTAVARTLQEAGLATLLMDLLTRDEESADARTGHLRFDIELLARRVCGATKWLREYPDTRSLPIGIFGASTGAAAALLAAVNDRDISAVVSRGGRPDLAMEHLGDVRAPTLLVVGGNDIPVIPLNQEAAAALRCEHDFVIVPGASHLFEEEGALDAVSALAAEWFRRHLSAAGPAA
ncbi:MAG: dienelactone hydrolase family protein [Gemmatimonadaceae bacterium]